MSYSKIIYIRYIPLTRKIYDDFYMQDVIANGIEVEYWDISSIFYSSKLEQEDSSHLVKTLFFNSYESLALSLSSLKDNEISYLISLMSIEKKLVPLFALFTKYKCSVAGFGRNMLPIGCNSYPISFFSKLKRFNYSKFLNYITNRLVEFNIKFGRLKTYDVVFLAGNEGYKALGYIPFSSIQKMHRILINSTDYDTYLAQKKEETLVDVNFEYILFLDEYLPFHPDWYLLGMNTIPSERYYEQLNKYFDKVELTFGKPVVIAAHPKALKYKEKNYFNGRKVYFGATSQLTKNADFVIAHMSTSISYSILYGKKLHFITSQDIKNRLYASHCCIINFAYYLDCNCQYFDRETEPIDVVESFSESAYTKYIYNFLTSEKTKSIESKNAFMNFIMCNQ